MKFSIKDFFSKCDQIRSFLRICSHFPADLITFTEEICKGAVTQIEKALTNDRSRVSKVS